MKKAWRSPRSISFLDHVLFPQVPDYHLHFRPLEERHQFPFGGDLEFHILELPKFTKSAMGAGDGAGYLALLFAPRGED